MYQRLLTATCSRNTDQITLRHNLLHASRTIWDLRHTHQEHIQEQHSLLYAPYMHVLRRHLQYTGMNTSLSCMYAACVHLHTTLEVWHQEQQAPAGLRWCRHHSTGCLSAAGFAVRTHRPGSMQISGDLLCQVPKASSLLFSTC